jgi:Endonuclease NucS C-terminal domain
MRIGECGSLREHVPALKYLDNSLMLRRTMKESEFREWLMRRQFQENTIGSRIANVRRVEEFEGDVDEHYSNDRMARLINSLEYTTQDERRDLPNPTRIPVNGNVRNGLGTLRSAVLLYRKFREAADDDLQGMPSIGVSPEEEIGHPQDEIGQRIGLEQDMQRALRRALEQLEPGLTIVDGGAERRVESGFIDITARDSAGRTVVIEIKAGTAGRDAIGQILGYMGNVVAEQANSNVRGILVASEFSAAAQAAARIVPCLALRRYSVRFMFANVNA